MTLKVEPLQDKDWTLSLMDTTFDAMGDSSQFVNAAYPKHHTKAGREQALGRLIAFK